MTVIWRAWNFARYRLRSLGDMLNDLWHLCLLGGERGLHASIQRGDFSQSIVLSAKFDAFGGRLGDVISAWRLADALDARLKLFWADRDLDGIRPAEEFFAPEFIARHLVLEPELSDHRVVRAWRPRDLVLLRREGAKAWYQSKHDEGAGKFQIETRRFTLPAVMSHGDAFAQIRFVPELELIRAHARTVGPFELAIHVRRGDMFRGHFRLGGHFVDKALPLPILRLLLATTDEPVLLVGNEMDAVRERLGDRSIVTPSDIGYPGEGTAVRDDFYDFCLLTHCRTIVAGKSVFARIPALVGGGALLSAEDLLTRRQMYDAIDAFVTEADGTIDLEVALACAYSRVRFPDMHTLVSVARLRKIAHFADPFDPDIALAQAAAHLQVGDRSAATETFERLAAADGPETCLTLLRNEFDLDRGVGLSAVFGGWMTMADWPALLKVSAADPWAAFYTALRSTVEGDRETANAMLPRFDALMSRPAVAEAASIVQDPPVQPAVRGGLLISPAPGDWGSGGDAS